MSDSDVHVNGFYAGTAEFDTGYSVGAAVGIMRETFRLDGELSYMASDMDTFDGFNSDAEIDSLTFLANGYYDFNSGGPIVITSYSIHYTKLYEGGLEGPCRLHIRSYRKLQLRVNRSRDYV